MSAYTSRPYEGIDDLQRLLPFAQRVTSQRRPAASYYHPGDFVWQLYAFDRSDDVRIWSRADSPDTVIACAIFEPPLNFQFEIDATADDQNGLITEILTWAERRRVVATDNTDVVRAYEWLGDDTISTTALDTDPARIAMLVQNGYAPRDEEVSFRTARSLADPLPPRNLPAGASFRSMTNADEEARSELHRDAWSVWGESKHDRERYHRLRSAPLYDPDLDVVLDVDGQLVSYCVCWPDAVNKIGLFEPVGTRPSATRRGYGRTVLHEAFRRLRANGMNTAIVSTGTVNKPAQALYASAGFKPVAREVTYTKTLP